MNALGHKQHSQIKGLGVKHKSFAQTLGSKGMPPQISNIQTPNKPFIQITGLGQNNLIPNKSNSSSLQYLPTGMKSKLEKK